MATLLGRYRTGYFPMAVEGGIGWFSPEPRGVIPLDRFQVPRRLARSLRQGRFQCTVNLAFRDVITACASREDTRGDWIDEHILESYCALHEAGHAHSIEVWDEDRLAGGLYGVSLRGAFFGESMFYRVRDALDCVFDDPGPFPRRPLRDPSRSGDRCSAPGSSSADAPSARCAPSSRS